MYVQFEGRTDLLVESELLEVFLEVNETKKMPQGCQLALSDVVTDMKHQFNRMCGSNKRKYRGNLSASNTATSTPSRARHDAAYEPPGPPPTTRTVTFLGCLDYSE